MLDAYLVFARAVCQVRPLAELGHTLEWDYLRQRVFSAGYDLTTALQAATILLQMQVPFFQPGVPMDDTNDGCQFEHTYATRHLLGRSIHPRKGDKGTWGVPHQEARAACVRTGA